MIKKAGGKVKKKQITSFKLLPREIIIDYIGISLGAVIFGISYTWFLFPFRVAPGGIGGLAQVLYYITGIQESFWMFGFNIPLFIIGWIVVGRQFGIRSFIGMFLSNLMCWVFNPAHFQFLPQYSEIVHNVAAPGELPRLAFFFSGQSDMDILLASIAGSALLGIGLGIIFKFRGSTGGTDIPVAIMKKYFGISISTGYWFVESIIILIVGAAFSNFTLVIWAYLNLFLTTKMTDLAAEGMPYVKAAIIISEYPQQIRDEIFRQLGRGVTFLKAKGGYNHKDREVIYVCIHRRQVMILQRIVRKVDAEAFMVLHDAYDVMGYGFKQRTITYH